MVSYDLPYNSKKKVTVNNNQRLRYVDLNMVDRKLFDVKGD
jgi:hypothetical protein